MGWVLAAAAVWAGGVLLAVALARAAAAGDRMLEQADAERAAGDRSNEAGG